MFLDGKLMSTSIRGCLVCFVLFCFSLHFAKAVPGQHGLKELPHSIQSNPG